MRFGLFGGAQAPRTSDGDPGRGFWEFIETSVEAERLGFYSTFLVEHHFSAPGRCRPPGSPAAGWPRARRRSGWGRRRSCRPGMTRCCWPSARRPSICLCRASGLPAWARADRHSEFAGFCVPRGGGGGALRRVSGGDPGRRGAPTSAFSHEGRFWRYHEIVVEPPTAQKPDPPALDRGRQARVGAQGRRARRQPVARPVRLHRGDR